jgi:hypothetical protein
MSKPDKTFENDCSECREIEREFHNQDMELFLERTEKMMDDKMATGKIIILKLEKHSRDIKSLKIALATVAAAVLFIFIYLFKS